MERLPSLQEVRILRLGQAPPFDLAIENLAAELDRCVVLFDAETLPDLVTRSPGSDVREPVAAGLGRRRRDYLHCLRVLELARETRNPSVDPSTLTMNANFGVDGEREIDWRRALRELDHVACRREDEDLVLIKVELQELEELVGSLRVEL